MIAAFKDGWRRVAGAPMLLVGVWVLTLLLAVPLALTLRAMIAASLGDSLAAETAASGVNMGWWDEFQHDATGIGTTFTPTIIGFAAVLDNISRLLDARPRLLPVIGIAAAYLLVWTFLAGGIIDRLARQRPVRAYGFFGASGVFFFRLLRLGIASGVIYAVLFWWVHGWLFDDWLDAATRDVSVERVAFAWRVLMYAIFGALLLTTNIVFDYARIRTIVEDRRSAIGAILAAARFLRRNAGAAAGLYLIDAVVFLLVIAVYALVAPGAGGVGLSMWVGLAISQIYIIARLAVKLQFLASQTALFQARLAHAGYAAAPQPTWPESAAAEAVMRDGPDN